MFEVHTKSPFDDRWEERDAEIEEAAGRPSAWAGTGFSEGCGGRDHGWNVATFAEALAMKARLDAVPDVQARIQEQHTPC